MSLYKDNKMFHKSLVLSKIKRGNFQFLSFLYHPPLSSLPHSPVPWWSGNFNLGQINIKDSRSNSNAMEILNKYILTIEANTRRYRTFLSYVSFREDYLGSQSALSFQEPGALGILREMNDEQRSIREKGKAEKGGE